MANSVFQDPFGVDWPLGYVKVATIGTPVNIMANVDPGNNNAPNSSTGEYTPTCHKVTFQGYQPGNANVAWQPNQGNIYIYRALGPGNSNSGGPGNRTDTGALLYVLPPGGFVTLPSNEFDGPTISPYRYTLDGDNNNDGAVVTLLGCARG